MGENKKRRLSAQRKFEIYLETKQSEAKIGEILRWEGLKKIVAKKISDSSFHLYRGKEFAGRFLVRRNVIAFSPYSADAMGYQKRSKLNSQDLEPKELDAALIKLSAQEMLNRPSQYTILYVMENMRMFFGESTNIGFVIYPDVLTKVFAFGPFKTGIRLLVSLISLISFIYVIGFVIAKRSVLLPAKPDNNTEVLLGFFILVICLGFIGSHIQQI